MEVCKEYNTEQFCKAWNAISAQIKYLELLPPGSSLIYILGAVVLLFIPRPSLRINC